MTPQDPVCVATNAALGLGASVAAASIATAVLGWRIAEAATGYVFAAWLEDLMAGPRKSADVLPFVRRR
jgi:hypothetical protein